MLPNWIPDHNKFNLAGPPKWWLKLLHEFDDSLVVVPSRQGFYYRLAQRRRLHLPDHIVNDVLFKESDTQMLSTYSLVPVTTIIATATWTPYMFEELANRAPWRMGGHEKVNKMLEAQDLKERIDTRVATDAHLHELSKDAWKLYRKKIGLGRSWSTEKAAPSLLKPTGQIAHRQFFGNF